MAKLQFSDLDPAIKALVVEQVSRSTCCLYHLDGPE
jgi:hypothetical protein